MSRNIGTIQIKYEKNRGYDLQTICLWVCYICCVLSGIVPQKILSLIIIACVIIICCRGNSISVWPIMIFYYSILGTIFGISVYRIFTILFLIVHCYRIQRPSIKRRVLPPLVVYIYYLVVVVFSHSAKTMLFSFVDIICAIFLVYDYLNNKDEMNKFFKSYVGVCFLAFLTGIISKNEVSVLQNYGGKLLTISRFSATFEDPNYMGFFYTVAIFAVVALKMYRPMVRVIIVVALYGIILTSMSMTAIIGNVLLWALFLLIRGNIRPRTVAMVAIALLAAIGLYNYGIGHPEVKLIGDMSLKIQDKMKLLFLKDFDSFSTGRTSLSEVHLNIFNDSSIIRQMFGGYAVNSYYIDVAQGANFSAHNEYIDMLLNVGIVGWIVMYGFVAVNALRKIVLFRKQKDNSFLCGMMMNFAWLYYVATLTVFLDFRYMFAFFI